MQKQVIHKVSREGDRGVWSLTCCWTIPVKRYVKGKTKSRDCGEDQLKFRVKQRVSLSYGSKVT